MWIKASFAAIAVALPLAFALGCWLMYGARPIAHAEVAASTQIACSLSPVQLVDRRARLAAFRARAREVRELDDGFALSFGFDAATLQESTNLIADESRCCGFLDFRLTAQPSKDLILFEITGPQGAKELLAANIPFDSSGEGCACEGADACSVDKCLPARVDGTDDREIP
jgi:hypothetical protein